MPANAASLHLLDVCVNRISTEFTISLGFQCKMDFWWCLYKKMYL